MYIYTIHISNWPKSDHGAVGGANFALDQFSIIGLKELCGCEHWNDDMVFKRGKSLNCLMYFCIIVKCIQMVEEQRYHKIGILLIFVSN